MTVNDVIKLLSTYPANAQVQVWSFSGPRAANKISVGSFCPAIREGDCELPAMLSLQPSVEES